MREYLGSILDDICEIWQLLPDNVVQPAALATPEIARGNDDSTAAAAAPPESAKVPEGHRELAKIQSQISGVSGRPPANR